MKAKSIKGKSKEEIQSALADSMKDRFKPTLAIVFISIKQDRNAICEMLDKEGIVIFGATSVGEFIDGGVGKESIAIMLMDIDNSYFKLIFEEVGIRNTREVANDIGQYGFNTFSNPAYIVCGSSVTIDGEMIIRGIEDAAGTEVTIVGGMASDEFTYTKTYVFTNNKSSDNGIAAIIINKDKIQLHGIATCGWQPVGTIKTITKSEGCKVYTIDNEPALDMIIKYMGIPTVDKEKIEATMFELGANFPLQLHGKNGNFVMRTAMAGNWEDHSFTCAGNVPQGSKIRFTIPADFEVIDTVLSECKEAKDSVIPEADAIILFSCAARLVALGPLISQEIQGLKDVWNIPMVGFFTYGEFGRSSGSRHEFHNITCSWVALKEK